MTNPDPPPSPPDGPSPSPAADATLLPIGTRLQEFEVTGFVGEGGFSMVYEGYDTSLNRRVAIKEYMPAQLATRVGLKTVSVRSVHHRETFDAGLKSFINEARLLAQFKHPALVEVFRFWEENQTGYLVMPYYDGQTLKQFLTADPVVADERWLQMLLAPLLDALGHMHSMDVYHRDIAPDNILVLRNGNPLLLDLGAARHLIADMTQAVTVILKPGYAPIEQYADDSSVLQGPWTDIYALSAVLYFAITRKAPPPSVARMIKDPLPRLAQAAAGTGFSHDFLAAIDRGLSLRPEDRPQSIDAFREMLGVSTFSMSSPTVQQTGTGRTQHKGSPAPSNASTRAAVPPADEGSPRRTGVVAPSSVSGTEPALPARPAERGNRNMLLGGAVAAVLALVTAGTLLLTDSKTASEIPVATPPNSTTGPAVSTVPPVEPTPAPAKEASKTLPAASTGTVPDVNSAGAKAAPSLKPPSKPRSADVTASEKTSTDEIDRREASQRPALAPPSEAAPASPPPPTAAPSASTWHAALIEELRVCATRNPLERVFCSERAKWKHCDPNRWGTVPECPAMGAGSDRPTR